MKKFWKSVGAALAYYAVFMVIQFWMVLVTGLFLLAYLARTGGAALILNLDLLFSELDRIMVDSAVPVLIFELLIMGIYWLFFRLRGKHLGTETGLVGTSTKNIGLAVAFGFGICYLVDLLTVILPIPQQTRQLSWGWDAVIFFLSGVITGPLCENILLQGLCYTRLRRVMRPVWAALIVSVLSGLWGEPMEIPAAMVFSFGFCWIFETTGSLWTSVTAQIVNNFVFFLYEIIPVPGALEWILRCLAMLCLIGSVWALHRMNRRPVEASGPELSAAS